jgi:hypothetical protein
MIRDANAQTFQRPINNSVIRESCQTTPSGILLQVIDATLVQTQVGNRILFDLTFLSLVRYSNTNGFSAIAELTIHQL